MCLGPSVSATRMMVMDQYEIRPDPCDNRIIRMTNCLMLFSCLCDLLSICIREFRHFAQVVHSVANCVAYSTIGCMASQVIQEVNYRQQFREEFASLADSDQMNSPMMGHATLVRDNKFPL